MAAAFLTCTPACTACTRCRRACARCAAPPPPRSPAPRSRSTTASAACSPPSARSLCRTSRRELLLSTRRRSHCVSYLLRIVAVFRVHPSSMLITSLSFVGGNYGQFGAFLAGALVAVFNPHFPHGRRVGGRASTD